MAVIGEGAFHMIRFFDIDPAIVLIVGCVTWAGIMYFFYRRALKR